MTKHSASMGIIGALAALALVAAPGPGPKAEVHTCPSGMEPYTEFKLFFGRNRGGVEVVSDAAWGGFLAEEVTPRFPDGLTVFDAAGQWRGPAGVIAGERSKVLLVLAEPGAESMRLTREIAEAYKNRFDQESVLRVVRPACASF